MLLSMNRAYIEEVQSSREYAVRTHFCFFDWFVAHHSGASATAIRPDARMNGLHSHVPDDKLLD